VPTVTLDWLTEHFPPPDIIKIDVEGGEVAALEGGAKLLSDRKPIVHCEVGDEHADAVGSLLRSHGYRFFDGEQAGFPSIVRPSYATIAVADESG
jgi:hypothetical protein